MSDGGLLLSWNESSHTTYMKEEVDRFVKLSFHFIYFHHIKLLRTRSIDAILE